MGFGFGFGVETVLEEIREDDERVCTFVASSKLENGGRKVSTFGHAALCSEEGRLQ